MHLMQQGRDEATYKDKVTKLNFKGPATFQNYFDLTMKAVYSKFWSNTKDLLTHWVDQKLNMEKHDLLDQEHKLHNHFHSEARFKWQFTKAYIQRASPSDIEKKMAQKLFIDVPVAEKYDAEKA